MNQKTLRGLFGALVFFTFCLFGWHTVAVDVFNDYIRGESEVGILGVGMSFGGVLGFALIVSFISTRLLARSDEEADAGAGY